MQMLAKAVFLYLLVDFAIAISIFDAIDTCAVEVESDSCRNPSWTGRSAPPTNPAFDNPFPVFHRPSPFAPIDVVYTWVNGSDPVWLSDMRRYRGVDADALLHKFREHNELLYSMRSVFMYAPWVRYIFLITARPQRPRWLNAHPRVVLIHHDQIFTHPPTQLPTFNSLAIESVLHRIPGLSDRFLYFNNDVLLGRPAALSTWVTPRVYNQFYDVPINRIYWPHAMEQFLRSTASRPPAAGSASTVYLESVFDKMCATSTSDDLSSYPDVCFTQPFFVDTVLSERAWKQTVRHWFAHCPHLWEIAGLQAVESAFPRELATARRNKFRDAHLDVSMHVQYEAWRRWQSKTQVPGGLRNRPINVLDWVDGRQPGNPYVFEIFEECDDRTRREFFAKLACRMSLTSPLFVTIDDGLHGERGPFGSPPRLPSADCVRDYQAYLHAFFRRYWPTPAPWEIASVVADIEVELYHNRAEAFFDDALLRQHCYCQTTRVYDAQQSRFAEQCQAQVDTDSLHGAQFVMPPLEPM